MNCFRSLVLPVVFSAAALVATGCASITGLASPGAKPAATAVSFLEPADGAVVHSPFLVRFGVTGMQIQPAGTMTEGTGHHHLLVNAADIPAMAAIPVDPQHLHFGKSQTETTLTLPPGQYTLTMQFGNGAHQAYGPAMNRTIRVTVQ